MKPQRLVWGRKQKSQPKNQVGFLEVPVRGLSSHTNGNESYFVAVHEVTVWHAHVEYADNRPVALL
jgi:hypothetical protein